VRYSVPHALIREHVDVALDVDHVRIFHGTTLVATHARCREPYQRVLDPAHVAGLWRVAPLANAASTLVPLGRSLDDYAALVGGGR
jgi:hypothetical protein